MAMALPYDLDPRDLADVGWGVVFAPDTAPEVREALGELLQLRARQAPGDRYREMQYHRGESGVEFLARHGAGPIHVDPARVPYYLLLVGDPEAVPFPFQRELDVPYAVGRVCFNTPEEYARYARGVVEAESGRVVRPRQVTFFSAATPGDQPTSLSAATLTGPLARAVADWPGWAVTTVAGDEATRSRLGRLLGGPDTPALLFTSGHGLAFPPGDARQRDGQGALLCRGWPGPAVPPQPLAPEWYFAGRDVAEDARPAGLIAFHHASYSAGSPRGDEFTLRAFGQHVEIAPRAFVARLPQRLLSHPRGGALAVIGQADRAWGYSCPWGTSEGSLAAYQATFVRLLDGCPVGYAAEELDMRYAAVATELSGEIQDVFFGKTADHRKIAELWTAQQDAANWMLLGDPAVRLAVDERPSG
jgi:hypothetical protein